MTPTNLRAQPLSCSTRARGFAIYRASHDGYEDSFLPTGFTAGAPEDALDTACGLCLADPRLDLNPDELTTVTIHGWKPEPGGDPRPSSESLSHNERRFFRREPTPLNASLL